MKSIYIYQFLSAQISQAYHLKLHLAPFIPLTPRITSSSYFLLLMSIMAITNLLSVAGMLRPRPSTLPEGLLDLSSNLSFDPHATAQAAIDFGRLTHAGAPAAVLRPSSEDDIAALIRLSYSAPRSFTIAARGHGHCVRGQALAPDGVVVDMPSLGRGRHDRINVSISTDGTGRGGAVGYVDAGGEQLWIDVLRESLKHGVAPRSWTDYLYLTVGGTLSNAGVSGQAFRHGPQISNVYELDVITGTGEMITCSHDQNEDLFYGVLGGLGQFGIITRARIAIEPAPEKVRWIRLIYTDFSQFTSDQERLISVDRKGFDYVEGSLLMDHTLLSGWRSSFFSGPDVDRIRALAAKFGSIYCLEGAVYHYESDAAPSLDQELETLLGELSFSPGFAFTNEVSYEQFLNRVHDGELKLRAKGLWDVPHPWLNIFLPRSRVHDLNAGVFTGILKRDNSSGPILVYPMNRNKWDERMSAVIPVDEEVFYSVGLLRSAVADDWKKMDEQNAEILTFCEQEGIKYKQYLPYYATRDEWMKHFGSKWEAFAELKRKYDPKAILSPGQGIFAPST